MEAGTAYLLFNGFHNVAAASDILKLYNIKNDIVRAPISMNKGCSFAIMVNVSEESMSRYILGSKGIHVI